MLIVLLTCLMLVGVLIGGPVPALADDAGRA